MYKVTRYALGMLGIMALSGCAVTPQTYSLTSRFDEAQANRLMQAGVNQVDGSALIRQSGGGVVTCAGFEIALIPKTAYASERITALYGNTSKGYNPSKNYQFQPNEPGYLKNMKLQTCDAQGRFSFKNVADGDFLLTTNIEWMAGNYRQGGSLMQAVSVSGGETKEVVLAP